MRTRIDPVRFRQGWEREVESSDNGHGIRWFPDSVGAASAKGARSGPDGRLWPLPTLVKLRAGDAIVCHHALPHAASWNSGQEPRVMVYFRLTRTDRPEGCASSYPDAMCDPWLEYEGLRATVAELGGGARL